MQQNTLLNRDTPFLFAAIDTLTGHTEAVTALAVLSEGLLASGSLDGVPRFSPQNVSCNLSLA